MFGLFFAFLAAMANALSSVLQRRADDEEGDTEFSLRMIWNLLRKPVWLFGILAVIAGFLLQAIALSYSQLAQVEPLLVLELPITILLAWRFLGEGMSWLKGGAIVAMTAGLAGLIFFLSPSAGTAGSVPAWKWGVAIGVGLALVGGLAAWGQQTSHDMARSAILGTATGAGFGITAGLMKGMTNAASHGFLHVFTAWQLYVMILTGALSMYLLQNALAAGKLVAAQPGFTLTDPVVAILWGVLVFNERVRHGLYMLLAVLSFALMVGAVVALSQTQSVQEGDDDEDGADGGGDGGDGDAHRQGRLTRDGLQQPYPGPGGWPADQTAVRTTSREGPTGAPTGPCGATRAETGDS